MSGCQRDRRWLRRIAVSPVQGTSRDDLDDRAFEEERERDACLEELEDDRLLSRPERQRSLPVGVRIAVDDRGVALHRRAIVASAKSDRVTERQADAAVALDVLELAREQDARSHHDLL